MTYPKLYPTCNNTIKLLYALLLSSTTICSTSAQELEMLSGNPQWSYARYYYNQHDNTEINTLIDDEHYGFLESGGKKYHRLYQTELLITDNGEVFVIPVEPLGVREEDGKVFVLYEDFLRQTDRLSQQMNSGVPIPYLQTSDNELLLYDYTVKIGERYPISAEYENIYVEKIDTIITADGKSRKLFMLTNGLKILEGVGCLNSKYGNLLYYLYPSEVWKYNNDNYSYRLYEYYQNGHVAYKNYVLPENVAPILSDANVTKKIYYDLQGRRLSAPPARGMYIQDKRVKIRDKR